MKGGLALLLFVVVVGIATCMPAERKLSLKERLDAIRGRKFEKGDGEKSRDQWPYGWIEFASLIGRCETARNWVEILGLGDAPAGKSILVEACQKAYECGAKMENATEEEKVGIGKYLNDNFHLMQCVNLHAEKEELEFALLVAGKDSDDDVYLMETTRLFEICDKVFDDYENEVKKLNKTLDEVEAKADGNTDGEKEEENEAQIKALLRQLISTAAKKR